MAEKVPPEAEKEITWFRARVQQLEQTLADLSSVGPSEKSDLRAADDLYRSTIDALVDYVHVVDREGRLLLFNRKYEALFEELGVDPAQVIGQRIDQVLTFLEPGVMAEYDQVVANGEILVTEEPVYFYGEEFITETRKIPLIEDGQVTRIVTIVRDITQRKEFERSLADSERIYRHIYASTLALAEEHELEAVIRIIADEATSLLHSRDCVVYMVDAERRVLCPIYSNAEEDHDEIMAYEMQIGEGLSGRVFETGVAAYINYDSEDDFSKHIPNTNWEEDERECVVSAPIFDDSLVIGVITVGRLDKKFRDRDITRLTIFARQAEIAVERANYLQEIEESRERFKLLSDFSFEGIVIYRGDEILDINQTFANLFGLKAQDVIGQSLTAFMRPVEPIETTFPPSNPSKLEVVGERHDGNRFIGELCVKPIALSGMTCSFAAIRDITERKNAEDALRQKATELEQAITKLRQSEDELAELNARKDRFISIVAHDLKSPFTALMGYIELLEQHIDRMTPAQIQDMVHKMSQETGKTLMFLEDLLSYSVVQYGRMDYAPRQIDLHTILGVNLELLAVSAQRKDIVFKSDIQPGLCVYADKHMVDTVFRNLIMNAIKFTSRAGHVCISNRELPASGQDSPAMVEVAVIDDGIGISSENQQKLFKIDDKYKRTGTEGEVGTGMGLILCQELIEKNGGQIWVESEEGAGSTFRFTLPKCPKP